MASRLSTIESHVQRERIVNALADGQPYRDVAAWTDPPVTIAALCRFKRAALSQTARVVSAAKTAIVHSGNELAFAVPPAVTKAALTVASDPFLAHAIRSGARRERWMNDIEEAGDGTTEGPDYRALASIDRNDLSGQELHARLAGRLDSPAQASTTTFVLMPLMGASTPAAAEVRVIEATDVVFMPDNPEH